MSFSSWWLLLLQSMGSRHAVFSSCVSQALGHRLGSCGTWTQFHGMWDLPRSGIEPMSPAWAGRFFTTEPPRKPLSTTFIKNTSCVTLGNFMSSLRHDVLIQWGLKVPTLQIVLRAIQSLRAPEVAPGGRPQLCKERRTTVLSSGRCVSGCLD